MNEIALVGWTHSPWELETDIFSTKDQFLKSPLRQNKYYLMILHEMKEIYDYASLRRFLESCYMSSYPPPPQKLILLVPDAIQPTDLVSLLNQFPIVSIVRESEMNRVQDLVNALLLTQRFEEQTKTHQLLLQEESEQQEWQYEQLVLELESQHKKMMEMQARLLFNLQQEKVLHETLFTIMTSHGVADIELRMQEILTPIIGRSHLRILLHRGAVHPVAWAPPAIGFDLYEEDKIIGQMIVTPTENQNFTRRQIKLLENISEAIALHIPRYLAFEANLALELEWRSTFDAISDPLIIVSESYQVLEANLAAKKRMPGGQLATSPCYQLLFNRLNPCTFCQFGTKSNREEKVHISGELWEMSSHSLKNREGFWQDEKQKYFIHLYRNKYQQSQMEEKLKEVSKAAEVGIFKASLAHELNNPLGGLLTLAQLQKMELLPQHPLFPMIAEIEKQALLCRDLIQNLLQKTRNSGEANDNQLG